MADQVLDYLIDEFCKLSIGQPTEIPGVSNKIASRAVTKILNEGPIANKWSDAERLAGLTFLQFAVGRCKPSLVAALNKERESCKKELHL